MMRILLVVPLLASLGVLGWSAKYYQAQQEVLTLPPKWPAQQANPSAWAASSFAPFGETGGDHFNFVTGLTVDPVEKWAARLAIHYSSPEDCLYVELAGQQFSLVAVRGGLSRCLASGELSAPLASGEHAFELRQRGPMVAAVLDGTILSVGFAESFSGGRAAVGSQGAGVTFRGPAVMELEPVLFLDDFMRPEGMASAWRKVAGTWTNKGPSKDPNDKRTDIFRPSMSANAFRYSATGKPAMAVTGQRTWDLYTFATSLRGAAGSQMGLVFGYRDERNYGLFRWTARTSPTDSAAGLAEIVAVIDGRETILERSLVGYIPDQWYRVEVVQGWGWAEVSVDGHRLMTSFDPRLSGGSAGLWASSGEAETLFDDVIVSETAAFQERFRGPAATWGSWDCLNASASPANGTTAEGLELSSIDAGAGLMVFGSSRWTSCVVRAEVLPRAGSCGLIYHYRDASNYSCLRYDSSAGRLDLLAVRGGEPQSLASVAARLEPGTHRFEVRIDRGLVRATVDGARELFAWQGPRSGSDEARGGAPCGRAGLIVWDGRMLVRSVNVALLADIEPLPIVNQIFATDAEMGTWSSWHGDWVEPPNARKGENEPTIRFHRARFTGDVQLLAEVPVMTDEQARNFELALSVAKSGDTPGNGYTLNMSRPSGGAPEMVLQRNGEKVASAPVPPGRVGTLALRRAGPFVVGSINSSELIAWRDPEPLIGQKVAWRSKGVVIEENNFRVYCPAVQNETFDRAPVEWRSADGIWEVTNRWQCDPRWSFFSGRPVSRQKRLAALWNKREMGDDVTVEFFAGIKMDSARGGAYQYARDINCTLSADGKDLGSGYSFVFGGFDNDRSAILRNGVEVASTKPGGNAIIPRTGGIHHRWFYIRAERKGATLHFTVDGGNLVDLTYTDPQPLAGKRMAVWSWDCGIIFSRVRVSGPDDYTLEPLDFVPGAGGVAPIKHRTYENAD